MRPGDVRVKLEVKIVDREGGEPRMGKENPVVIITGANNGFGSIAVDGVLIDFEGDSEFDVGEARVLDLAFPI